MLIEDTSAIGRFRQHLQSFADEENKHIDWMRKEKEKCFNKGMAFEVSSDMEVPPEYKSPVSILIINPATKNLPEPKNKVEEYRRYYIILSSIHDNKLPEVERIDNGILPEQTTYQIWISLDEFYDNKHRRVFIEQALERVKAQKPAETRLGQQAETPSEIELMEQFAEELKSLASIERCPKSSGAFNQWKIQLGDIINVGTFWKVADWLRYRDAPLDDGKVWKDADELWKLVNKITDDESNNYKIFGRVDEVRGYAFDLAETLLRKAEIARQRLKRKKPTETEKDTTAGKCRRIRAWLKRHPHRYGLTAGAIFLILFLVLGLFKAQWRQWCWGVAGLAFLVLIVSLLGGRSR